MTREEWFCFIQDFIAKRIVDAPDDDCRALAEAILLEATDMMRSMPDLKD